MTFSGFSIARSTTISAPPAEVFDLIVDLRSWERWNPNGRDDATVERTYGGAVRGAGATAAWRGGRSGAGRMEIVSATLSSEVVVIVDFERPMKARNRNTFTLAAPDSATTVTWAMQGPKPLIGRLLGLVFDMDKMMARHFDAGLAALKAIAET